MHLTLLLSILQQRNDTQLVELEHEYSNQKSDFVDSLGKLLRTQVKGGSSKSQLPPGTLAQRATDLGHARRSFEQSRQHLACKVDELDTKYTLELTESIAACLFALQSFHHHVSSRREVAKMDVPISVCLPDLKSVCHAILLQSMDLVSSLNPRMEELRVTQTKARTSLHSSKSQWERRAEMLDMLLPVDVAGELLIINERSSIEDIEQDKLIILPHSPLPLLLIRADARASRRS